MKSNPIFENTRYNARTVKALINGTDEEITNEMAVEGVLNVVFGVIEDYVEHILENEYEFKHLPDNEYMYVDIHLSQEVNPDLYNEIRYRIEDYGYTIELILDAEEDADYFNELLKMAEEDETVGKMLDEFSNTVTNFRVSWHTVQS
jgi:hypothetical protein